MSTSYASIDDDGSSKRLIVMNTVSFCFDIAFLAASIWLFASIAHTLTPTIAWYYLLVAFILPIALPTYAIVDRLAHAACAAATGTDPVTHAHNRAMQAQLATSSNFVGVLALVFWLPVYLEALEQAPLSEAWRRGISQPTVVCFGITYLFTLVANCIVCSLYRVRAKFELQRYATQSPAPSPHDTLDGTEMRLLGDHLHTMQQEPPPADRTRVTLHKPAKTVGRPKKKWNRSLSSTVEQSLDDTRHSGGGDGHWQ